jgi:hypothetical protein
MRVEGRIPDCRVKARPQLLEGTIANAMRLEERERRRLGQCDARGGPGRRGCRAEMPDLRLPA